MSKDDDRVIGYLALHPNSKETTMSVNLNIHVADLWKILKRLEADGLIESAGYAAHSQEWWLIDKSPMKYENLGRYIKNK